MTRKYAIFDAEGVCTAHLIEGINDIPSHAVAISDVLFLRMIQETDGKWRIDNLGVISKTAYPVDFDIELGRRQVEIQRLRAYAEPLTGSDRYFAEAHRMQVMNEGNWESVRAAGVARFEEIRTLYPWEAPVGPESL